MLFVQDEGYEPLPCTPSLRFASGQLPLGGRRGFRWEWKGVVAKPPKEEERWREGEVCKAVFNGRHVDEGDDGGGDVENNFVPG